MFKSTKVRVAFLLASIAGLAALGTQDAQALTLNAFLNDASTPAADGWEDCSGGVGSGRRVETEAAAYNSSNMNVCFAHSFTTGTTVSNNACPASAVKSQARLRRNFLVDCTSAQSAAWTDLVSCNANVSARVLGTSGACTSTNFTAASYGN